MKSNQASFTQLAIKILVSHDSKKSILGYLINQRTIRLILVRTVIYGLAIISTSHKNLTRFRNQKNSKSANPLIVVLSLTKEQLCLQESESYLTDFITESRFENSAEEIVFESKMIPKPGFKKRNIVASAPLYIFLKKLDRYEQKSAFDLFNAGSRLAIEFSNLKSVYNLFELSIWYVSREREITIITTQSALKKLPIAFSIEESNFIRKMFWYSVNSKPITKNSQNNERHLFDQELQDKVDIHYVWDTASVEFLKINGVTRSKAVGSIVFAGDKQVHLEFPGFSLVYFDVTPLESPDSYYTVERMCFNLQELVKIARQLSLGTGKRINLFVKPKRSYTKAHSRKYINLLNSLEKENQLYLLEPDTNLYGLIDQVDCVVGVPFTSPIAIASELGTPTMFIDFYSDEYLLPEVENKVPVLRNPNEVIKWLKTVLELNSI